MGTRQLGVLQQVGLFQFELFLGQRNRVIAKKAGNLLMELIREVAKSGHRSGDVFQSDRDPDILTNKIKGLLVWSDEGS